MSASLGPPELLRELLPWREVIMLYIHGTQAGWPMR